MSATIKEQREIGTMCGPYYSAQSISQRQCLTYNTSLSPTQLSSGQITRCIQNIWSRAGKISCTLIRKAAVTAIHQPCPDQKANLADLMCHTASTASKYYRQVDRNRTSTEAAKHLSSALRPAEVASVVEDDISGREHSASEPVHPCKFVWDEKLTQVILSVFHGEITSKSISIDVVRS